MKNQMDASLQDKLLLLRLSEDIGKEDPSKQKAHQKASLKRCRNSVLNKKQF